MQTGRMVRRLHRGGAGRPGPAAVAQGAALSTARRRQASAETSAKQVAFEPGRRP
jgi:hypothetical protein